jgi:methyltransferase
VSWLYLVLGLVALQRLVELIWSRRNERRLREAGAVEVGRRHYPLLVLLHASWLSAMLFLVPPETRPDPWLLSAYGVVQGLRLWTMASLGRFWTTRVLSLPRAPLVRHGPYRWLRHPNYLVVIAEIALLPLSFGAVAIALIFSALNLILLAIRIRVEDAALAPRRILSKEPS